MAVGSGSMAPVAGAGRGLRQSAAAARRRWVGRRAVGPCGSPRVGGEMSVCERGLLSRASGAGASTYGLVGHGCLLSAVETLALEDVEADPMARHVLCEYSRECGRTE